MPKLSVISINLNNRLGLEKTIKSVIDQSFQDFEYIVIDGASTDGSIDVIKANADKFSYWVSEKDKGIYHAQNKGIAHANGEYLLFLNSGDYLYSSNVLQTFFSKNYSEDILYGDLMLDNGGGKPTYLSSPNPITFEEMIRGTLWHPVSFIKKNLFEKYGYYNEKLKIASDYEFFLKTIFIHNVSHRHISIPISVFKNDGIGSSKEFELLHQQERRLVQLNFFPEKVIESALRLSNMKRSKPIIISSWLTNKPILKKIVSFAYHMFKPFK